MKVLSSFFWPILLDKKRKGNKGAIGQKAPSKAALLILPLHNFFENNFLLLVLFSLIVLSSFCFFAATLGVGVFGKNNAGKRKGDNPGSIGAYRGTKADNPNIKKDVDRKADNPGTAADNPNTGTDNSGIAIDNLSTAADNLDTVADNPGIRMDADARSDNLGTAADDLGTGLDTDVRANNSGTTASNKARARLAYPFLLHHALVLLVPSSVLVTASLPSFLPSSSLTTLRSKPILLWSKTLMKQGALSSRYPINNMWGPSLNKVSSKMSAMVRLL